MEPSTPDERESAYDLLQRGHTLLEQHHFAQAAIVLERANRVEPGKGSILEALGRAYFNSGQAEPARATFEALLEVDPSSHYGHYAIGQCLKRLGQIDRARTHLRLAVALNPDDPLYTGALGRIPPARARRSPNAGDARDARDAGDAGETGETGDAGGAGDARDAGPGDAGPEIPA